MPIYYFFFHNVYFSCISVHFRASLVAQMVKSLPAVQKTWGWSLGREDSLERKWQPTPVFFPGKSHWQRSLAGYSPWRHEESDMTERLHFLSFFYYSISYLRPWPQVTIASWLLDFLASCYSNYSLWTRLFGIFLELMKNEEFLRTTSISSQTRSQWFVYTLKNVKYWPRKFRF